MVYWSLHCYLLNILVCSEEIDSWCNNNGPYLLKIAIYANCKVSVWLQMATMEMDDKLKKKSN